MSQTDGRVGRVHALPAGAARAIHVDAHVGGVQIDLDVVGQHREHFHTRESSVTALLVVGRGDAHEAVDAVFAREHAVGVSPFDLDGRLVKADALAGNRIEHGDLPVLVLGVVQIHLVEHLGPVLRLEPTRSRVDRQNSVARVEAAGEPRGDFKPVELLVELREQGFCFLGERLVFVCELRRRAHVVEQRAGAVVFGDDIAQVRRLLRDALRARRVVPKARRGDLGVEPLQLDRLVVDVQVRMRVGNALGGDVDVFYQFFVSHSLFMLPAKTPRRI